MKIPFHNRSALHATRLFPRCRLDLRAKLVAQRSSGEFLVVHGRTSDLSRTGAGLTITRELPSGTSVVLCLRLPGGRALCLRAVIARRQGFRIGVRFLPPTPGQRLLLSELCNA